MRHTHKLLFLFMLLSAACSGPEPPDNVATTISASTGALEVFNLQARIFCPTGDWCGHPDAESLANAYYRAVDEMDLEYIPTGFSFHALPPIITQEDRFSTMTDSDGTAGNGESNNALESDLIAIAAPQPDRITLFLIPGLAKCWNGIPCPGEDDGFDGDDVIFCSPPGTGIDDGLWAGMTYAHEMGHYWCLRHTFTMNDPSGSGSVDQDGDNDACDTLINVIDTPADPGELEDDPSDDGADVDSGGNIIAWHEWCESSPADVDPGSPHASSCTVQCFQEVGGQPIASSHSPLTENAMSYYDSSCTGPYIRDTVRHEAFTFGQTIQIQQCRSEVLMRATLSNVCDADSDYDGICDDEDLCPVGIDSSNADSDGDGVGDACDLCPNDPVGYGPNNDGDMWCDQDDACPLDYDAVVLDSDGDGVWDTCDLCPNDYDPTNLDTDGDGLGDVCDPDDDNDGCSDQVDQHPKDDEVPVGVVFHPNCPDSTSPILAFEGANSDSDPLVNCRDPDDDNDGIPDNSDKCPLTLSQVCFHSGSSCPLNPIFFTCANGGCNTYLIRIVEAINPDPTKVAVMQIDSVSGDQLIVEPITGRSARESVDAVRGQLTFPSGRPQGPLTMQLLDVPGHRLVDLASYLGNSVQVGSLTQARLSITLPRTSMPMSVTTAR